MEEIVKADDEHSVSFCKDGQSLEINLTKLSCTTSKANETGNFEFKEGGFGWLVTIACAICLGFFVGNVNSYSLIYNKFLEEYKVKEVHVVSLAAWIGSSSNGVQSLLCSLGSVLVYLFDARKIGAIGGLISCFGLLLSAYVTNMKLYFVTFGLMLGTGQALLVSSFLSILPHYFKKRIGLANGLMTLGAAVITISLPFIVEFSLVTIGLSATFYVLSGFSFLTVLSGLTFIPRLPDKKPIKYCRRVKESFKLKIFKMKRFNIWVFASCLGFFGYLIPVYTISHFCTLLFPNHNPAILSSLFGAVSGFSGIIFGKINDSSNFSPIYFHVLSFLLSGLMQILLPFVTNFISLCVLICFFGVCDGLFLSFIVPCAIEVTNSHKLANQAVGYYFGVTSLSVMFGPMLAGLIYEWYESYDIAYYIGGGFCIGGALFLVAFYPQIFVTKKITEIRNKRKVSATPNIDVGQNQMAK